MGIHYTTAVVPAARSGADTDNAVLIFAADTADDVPQARVCVVLEPLSEAPDTSHVPASSDVSEPELSSWAADVIAGCYKMALRSVRVYSGDLPAWAQRMRTP